MNRKRLLPRIMSLTMVWLLVAACGAVQPTPRPTPIPPTNTPAPTDTPQPTARRTSLSDLPTDTLALSLPGMKQIVVSHVDYPSADGSPLPLDIYTPPDSAGRDPLPVVVFVMGTADWAPYLSYPLKEESQYISWGRLVAASGLIAITYQTERHDDLEAVMAWIQENGHLYGMDPHRIGLWSCADNSPTAVSFAMQEARDYLKFAVFYYGQMLTPDNEFRDGINEMCARSGCYAAELKDVTQLRTDLPLLIVRGGREPMLRYVNDSIDHFLDFALAGDVDVTLIEFEEGRHRFEEEMRTNPRSAEIIEQTLEFMKTRLQ
jgi:acetyl esterase/lipase